jgi:hypothetical protein
MAARKRSDSYRGIYRRPTGVRQPNLVAWIFCEGEQTEPLYFEALRVAYQLDGVKVRTAKKSDALGVVEAAIDYFKRNQPRSEAWDEIWCIFDRDNISVERFNKAFKAVEQFNYEQSQASRKKKAKPKPVMRIAYSNPCFELWYLLHFQYHNTQTSCEDCCSKLAREIGGQYRKNADDMFDRLAGRQADARKHAAQLLEQHGVLANEHANPSTTVHLLVETLNRYRQR